MATALVVAAGSGERLAAGEPKALVELAGLPILAWSMRALAQAGSITGVAIAAPPGYEARIEVVAREAAPGLPMTVVSGGASRSESVWLALDVLEGGDEIVVHDAARPLAKAELFDRCVSELGRLGCDGIVAATPVSDTIKRAGDDQRVSETLNRNELWSAQTPQVFRRAPLMQALDSVEARARATDDAMLVEQAGGDVCIVEAPDTNLKITTPADLALAERLLRDAD